MLTKLVPLVLGFAFSFAAFSQSSQPKSFSLRKATTGIIVDVRFTKGVPNEPSAFVSSQNWHAKWRLPKDTTDKELKVSDLTIGNDALSLILSGVDMPPKDSDIRKLHWNLVFEADGIDTASLTFSPPDSKKSCDDSTNSPFLCPPGPADTPDLLFKGSFAAGGGTNPLYALQATGGLVLTKASVPSLQTGVNIDVEINQGSSTPVHRTQFDPDSITAGLAFTHFFAPADGPKYRINGSRLQFGPGGEFNRTDPSSNFIFSGLATLDFVPWGPSSGNNPVYFTLYPFAGVEIGRNLNRPSVVDMTPVNLTTYKGIARGYAGANSKFAIADSDENDQFSISGTYRLRIPAIDEPYLSTTHQITSVVMTTKARHWIEADVAYTIPAFKYLSVSATYQYGEKPPFFSFVDHSVTIGLTLQALQSHRGGAKLIQ